MSSENKNNEHYDLSMWAEQNFESKQLQRASKPNIVCLRQAIQFCFILYYWKGSLFFGQFMWNFMKLDVLVSLFFAQKRNWLWWHYFMGLKLWNRQSRSGTKWNRRLRRSRVPSVSFCFPTDLWRFYNFMFLKIMKPSASFIFDAKIIRKNAASFIKFSRETVAQ